MKKVLSALMVSAILAATSANAFDNHRRGFMLDLGIGTGVTSFTQKIEAGGASVTGDRETDLSVLTNFRIGAGINRLTQIYWMSRVSWFSLDNALGSSVTIANGFGGIGLTRFARPMAPSPYFFGGIGISTWGTPFESDNNTWVGLGLAGGFGFEFSHHTSIEAVLTYGNPSDSELDPFSGLKLEATTNAIVFGITFNYMAY